MKTKISEVLVCFVIMFLTTGVAFGAGSADLKSLYQKLGLSETLSYTADLVVESDNSPEISMKVYFKEGNIRAEGNQGGMSFVTITLLDGVIYTYNSAMKTWMKTQMKDVMKSEDLPDYKAIGIVQLDGVKCRKFESLDPGTEALSRIFVRDGMIYQVEGIDPDGKKSIIRYTNLEKKKLDDSLFGPEPGKQVQDLTALMKNLMNK